MTYIYILTYETVGVSANYLTFAAPGTIDGNPVGPDSSRTNATANSLDKGISVIRFDDVVREIT